MDKGVLTGCDHRQEYLLKWWWKNYSKHNDYPVTFCDFGMTPSARTWCQTKGNIVTQTTIPIQNLSEGIEKAPWIDSLFPLMWNHREAWFQKAFVQTQSPYNQTIWLDLDCEVKKNLLPLYELTQVGDGFAIAHYLDYETKLARSRNLIREGVKGVQAGVFAHRKDSPVIPAWIEWCKAKYTHDFSDETCLSHLLHEKDFNIVYMSRNFNWTTIEQANAQALILHHASATRKRNLLPLINFND
ncbi:MAG: hypothetical protein KDK64_02235 [Chlamydiia bacterium]|nr:hypothetical protein [Chlamydiia bacterium]